MQARIYFHSPFSESNIYTKKDQALLLSFALSELFTCVHELPENWAISLPSLRERFYDAPLNKLQEHATLLLIAFPQYKDSILQMKEEISRLIYFLMHKIDFSQKAFLKHLFSFLEPLVKECQTDKNLLFFLLNHNEEISYFLDVKYLPDLFKEFHPEGLPKLQILLCDYFHKKGFTRRLPEITLLIKQLNKKRTFP